MNYEISMNKPTSKIRLHNSECHSIHIHSNRCGNQEYKVFSNLIDALNFLRASSLKDKGICSKCLKEIKDKEKV